jgi:hypothetical protein
VLWRTLIFITFIGIVTPAHAQSPVEAYVAGGLGRWVHSNTNSGTLAVGAAGVEWLAAPYLGIGGEGGVFPSDDSVMFSLGVDARVHFRGVTGPGEWAPYVLVGYSPLKFFEASDHGAQFGGGVDYRLSRRRAIRFELRDILRESGTIRSHYWTARVGVTFR